MMATMDQPTRIRWWPDVVADWREAFAVCLDTGEPIVVRDVDGTVWRLHPDRSATEVMGLPIDVAIGGDGDA